MPAHADRTHAGPAAAMRDAKGLVQIDVGDIDPDAGRAAQPDQWAATVSRPRVRSSRNVVCSAELWSDQVAARRRAEKGSLMRSTVRE